MTRSISEKRYDVLTTLILLAASALVYLNSIPNGFVWDDFSQIIENGAIRKFGLTLDLRMIKYIILSIEYRIWGLFSPGYHLTNVALHALCVILLYRFLLMAIKDRVTALIAAILFAVHPVHSESVAAISNRTDLLAMVFMLASLMLYIKSAEKKIYLALSVPAYLAGIVSKEAPAITVPVLIIAYDYLFSGPRGLAALPRRAWHYAAYLIVLAPVPFMVPSFIYHYKASSTNTFTALKAVTEYLRLAFWPLDLNADYVISPAFSFFEPAVLIGVCIIAVFVAICVASARRSPEVSFGAAWFIVTLFPMSNLIVKLTQNYVAERYLYVPSAGICLIVAVLLRRIDRIKTGPRSRFDLTGRRAVFLIMALICLLSAVRIVTRNPVWRSEYDLWTATVRQSPGSYSAHMNLGDIYFKEGRYDMAMSEYTAAASIEPSSNGPIANLGIVYDLLGRTDEAEAMLNRAVIMDPDDAISHNSLGNIYAKKGLFQKAKAEYETALLLSPEYIEAHLNIGHVYRELRLYDEALDEFKKINDIIPDNIYKAFIFKEIGGIYMLKGLPKFAVDSYSSSLKLNASDPDIYFRFGEAYERLGVGYEAERNFKIFLGMVSDDSKAQNTYSGAIAAVRKKLESRMRQLKTYSTRNYSHLQLP